MRLSDESFRGRTIIAADGLVVGEVTALFLDSEAWRVESLQVKLGKDVADHLGAERTIFHAGALEIPMRMVQSVGDTVVLSVSVNQLREVLPKPSEREAPIEKLHDINQEKTVTLKEIVIAKPDNLHPLPEPERT